MFVLFLEHQLVSSSWESTDLETLLLTYVVQHFTFLINEGRHLFPCSDTTVVLCHVFQDSDALEQLCGIKVILVLSGLCTCYVTCLNSALLPHGLQASRYQLPISWSCHGSLIHSVSLVPEFPSVLVTGTSAEQTFGYCLSSQEGLMGFIRACESGHIDTVPSFRNKLFLRLGLLWLEI